VCLPGQALLPASAFPQSETTGDSVMRNSGIILLTMVFSLTFSGCGDITVNPPSRPVVIEKKTVETPVIIEKKTVEKPVIIEKR
jgi:hypothetical protein